jgi:hypothetical protein
MAYAPRAKRTPAPKNETNEAKFMRLAGNRAGKAVEAIRLLGSLANPKAYGYSQTQLDKMFGNLQNALNDTKAKFDKAGSGETTSVAKPFMDLSA